MGADCRLPSAYRFFAGRLGGSSSEHFSGDSAAHGSRLVIFWCLRNACRTYIACCRMSPFHRLLKKSSTFSFCFLGSRATDCGRDHGGDPIDFLRTPLLRSGADCRRPVPTGSSLAVSEDFPLNISRETLRNMAVFTNSLACAWTWSPRTPPPEPRLLNCSRSRLFRCSDESVGGVSQYLERIQHAQWCTWDVPVVLVHGTHLQHTAEQTADLPPGAPGPFSARTVAQLFDVPVPSRTWTGRGRWNRPP